MCPSLHCVVPGPSLVGMELTMNIDINMRIWWIFMGGKLILWSGDWDFPNFTKLKFTVGAADNSTVQKKDFLQSVKTGFLRHLVTIPFT